MRRIFLPGSPYTKWARFIAVLWTLLIFAGCLTPSEEIPHVDVPFVDKWTHLVMFGVFSFLWMCVKPSRKLPWLTILFLVTSALGAIIEGLQGTLTSLGRSMELMDWYADTVGGALGIAIFCLFAYFAGKNTTHVSKIS